MAKFLLDENLRGALWHLIRRHNARGLNPIDVIRVGDTPALPSGMADPAILKWCEQYDHIFVTLDKRTIPFHFALHLSDGGHSPGIFLVSSGTRWLDVVEFLIEVAYASHPDEWRDSINYV